MSLLNVTGFSLAVAANAGPAAIRRPAANALQHPLTSLIAFSFANQSDNGDFIHTRDACQLPSFQILGRENQVGISCRFEADLISFLKPFTTRPAFVLINCS
jgi:hypothetical protein